MPGRGVAVQGRPAKAVACGLAIWIFSVGISGCSNPSTRPGQSLPAQESSSQVAELEVTIAELMAEIDRYRGRLQAAQEEADRWRRQALQLEQTSQVNRDLYRQALQSPGYEAALRLVYHRLQQGDTSLIQELLPEDEPVEAGILDKEQRTYRLYGPGEAVELQQFVEWGKSRPLEVGTFSVVATRPGYAWAMVAFPDGTHFRIMFSGWFVTKILATDEPMMLT